MAYRAADAREQLLGDLADAASDLALALASLSEAYELSSEDAADQLEEQVFRPVQAAYGAARRTYSEFAARHSLPESGFADPSPGMHTADARIYLQRAIEAAERADARIAEMQDSLLPVEVGDPPLRAGLAQTRTAIAPVPGAGARLLRTFGR
jgi:hypothetical protein